MHRFDLQSAEFMRDPFPTFERMRAAGPVIELKLPLMGRCWCTTTHAATMDFLKGADKFASDGRNVPGGKSVVPRWMPKSIKLLSENMLMMDEPDHRRLRKLVDAPFLARRIDEFRPEIAQITEELLDKMEVEGQRDFVAGFARALPLIVICDLLGLGGEDRRGFMRWTERMMRGVSVWHIFALIPALSKMLGYIRSEIAEARAGNRTGLLTELVEAEQDGDRMSEDELVAMVAILFVAGHETTTHLLSTSVATLCDRRDLLEELQSDWSLLPQALEELHRYNSPVAMTKPRIVRDDCEFHGARMKRGDKIIASLAAANSDPAMFPDPQRIDFARENAARHAGFGGGIHLCLGLQLARAEAQVAVERLFARWPKLDVGVPQDQREWITRLGIHGYRSLPVKFDSRVAA